MSDKKGILIVALTQEGKLLPSAYELLSAGRKIFQTWIRELTPAPHTARALHVAGGRLRGPRLCESGRGFDARDEEVVASGLLPVRGVGDEAPVSADGRLRH